MALSTIKSNAMLTPLAVFTSIYISKSMMIRVMLRDDQWERIEALLLGRKGKRGRTAANNRQFFEAVIWIARTGST